jgi:hypothetical protein
VSRGGGAHLIEIAPDIQPQHVSGVISGPPRCRTDRALEGKPDKIKAADKSIDDTNQSIRGNLIIDARRQ